MPGVDQQAVAAELKTVVGPGVEVTPVADSSSPARPSPLRADVVGAYHRARCAKLYGKDVPIIPHMSTGATDGLYFRVGRESRSTGPRAAGAFRPTTSAPTASTSGFRPTRSTTASSTGRICCATWPDSGIEKGPPFRAALIDCIVLALADQRLNDAVRPGGCADRRCRDSHRGNNNGCRNRDCTGCASRSAPGCKSIWP